ELRRVQRRRQPKRSRGSGLFFASPQRRAQQKQGTATVARRAGEGLFFYIVQHLAVAGQRPVLVAADGLGIVGGRPQGVHQGQHLVVEGVGLGGPVVLGLRGDI